MASPTHASWWDMTPTSLVDQAVRVLCTVTVVNLHNAECGPIAGRKADMVYMAGGEQEEMDAGKEHMYMVFGVCCRPGPSAGDAS